jgi:hypothetical protein
MQPVRDVKDDVTSASRARLRLRRCQDLALPVKRKLRGLAADVTVSARQIRPPITRKSCRFHPAFSSAGHEYTWAIHVPHGRIAGCVLQRKRHQKGTIMLRSVNEFTGYTILATDGEIGRCKDFLFDDHFWTIRYMVADTGKWLPKRKVLISPMALSEPKWAGQCFPVSLTRQQVEDSPPLEADAPVSQKYERMWFNYYGWPYYWHGGDVWGPVATPSDLRAIEKTETGASDPDKSRLRSTKEVTGYHINAADGEIGHVEDFVLDDATWTLRYVVVDTRNWLPGRKVLVSPTWVRSVDWGERLVNVDLSRESVRNSPKYEPDAPVNREYETRLYDYYGRPAYWK